MEKEKSFLECRLNTLEGKVDDRIRELENKMTIETVENDSKNLNDDKINKMERRIYVLEKRRLGSDFCDEEFNLGSEKDRKAKDIHIRDNHTFECNVIEMKLKVSGFGQFCTDHWSSGAVQS